MVSFYQNSWIIELIMTHWVNNTSTLFDTSFYSPQYFGGGEGNGILILQMKKLSAKKGKELSQVLPNQKVSAWELNPGVLVTPFKLATHVNKGLICSLSRAVYILKSKRKKYFNLRRMKWIPTDQNHGRLWGSQRGWSSFLTTVPPRHGRRESFSHLSKETSQLRSN